MDTPVSDLHQLLAGMNSVLHAGVFVFCHVPADFDVSNLGFVCTMREAEGQTLILDERLATELALTPLFRARWITLTVHSDLAAVGLTAAVAGALSAAGISCNVVAGAFHDHLFVPVEAGAQAIEILRRMGHPGAHLTKA